MSEMEDKLQKLLSDPQAIAQALSMVSAFMGQPSQNENTENSNNPQKTETVTVNENLNTTNEKIAPTGGDMFGMIGDMLPQLLGSIGSGGGKVDNRKLNLLMAVKPFCNETHQKSIDHAISMVKIAKTAQVAMNNLPKGFIGNI